jgi:hypothetical protein
MVLNRKQFIKIMGLIILFFFTIEYLEPSTNGIRINPFPYSDPTPAQSNAPTTNPQNLSPHAMIGVGLFTLLNVFTSQKLYLSATPLTLQPFSKEIFHPPLASA